VEEPTAELGKRRIGNLVEAAAVVLGFWWWVSGVEDAVFI
jgi:hypothetical protein